MNKKSKQTKSDAIYLMWKIIILAVMLVLLFVFVFGFIFVKDNNMYPRISEGDLFLYYRLSTEYSAGDVVVCDIDDTQYIGRIVAIEGDTVNVTEDGQVIVNGTVSSTDNFYPCLEDTEADINYPYQIKNGEYFLLSDYCAEVGYDSRTFGTVTHDNIKGKAFTIIRRRGF